MPDSSAFTIRANNSQLLDLVSHEIVSVHVAGVQSCTSCFIVLFFFILFNPPILVQVPPVKLSNIIPNASSEAIDLMTVCFS